MTDYAESGDVEVLKDWRETTVTPALKLHGERLSAIEGEMKQFSGSLAVIKWLVGINVTLMIGLLVTLFAWGLSHITLRVQSASPFSQSQRQSDLSNSPYILPQ